MADKRSHRPAKASEVVSAGEAYLTRLGAAVAYLAQAVDDPPGGEIWLKEIRFKVRYGEEGDILAIVKGEEGEGDRIAFNAGETLDEALIGLANRMRNGSLKWKEDKPYADR